MVKRFFTSCFGLGRLPFAPGTWGSLLPAAIFGVLGKCGLSIFAVQVIMVLTAVAASVICVGFSPAVIEATGKKDPGEIVADEFAGQAVTYLIANAVIGGQVAAVTVTGFALFRFFDILKPWPVNVVENLPAGWGILADDLLAGVYAGLVLLLFYKIGWLEKLNGLINNLLP